MTPDGIGFLEGSYKQWVIVDKRYYNWNEIYFL